MHFRFLSCFLVLLTLFTFSHTAFAQEEDLKTDFEHFYDELTLEKLSKLYWKLGKLNINDDEHIDNFLRINECDIYKDYYFNEFEWAAVRERARAFLKDSSDTFPVRYKYVQPLRLTDYNEATGMFGVAEDYQIKGYRKFEVLSTDFRDPVCDVGNQANVDHYPRILLVELTQPLSLREIPVSSKRAKEYVQEKLDYFNAVVREDKKTKRNLYEYRDAYIVMKIKVFSYKGEEIIMNGWVRGELYAMLEGYEIYADQDHQTLLYFENYVREQEDNRPVNVKLREQYEALRRKRGDVIEDEPETPKAKVEEVKEEPDNSLMNLKAE